MGFDLTPDGNKEQLRVAIDYDLPTNGIKWLLGRVLGDTYAKWCTRQMVRDAQDSFAV